MGIRLLLHSEPGEGTSISLVLPRTNSTAEVLETSAPALPSLPGLHILVVDDEMAVRLGMRTLLEALDCEVSLTSSTVEAIQHARARRPDLALVDFRLRDEDNGLKAINALRTLYPDLPALLISGDTAPDRLREAHLAKVQLLHKPVKVEELWNAVSALVPAAKRRVSQRHGHSGVVSESARRVQR
jgi:CheY-like chemotaxis protein